MARLKETYGDIGELEKSLGLLDQQESQLRDELARARRVLALERAATRPTPVSLGPLGWGLTLFITFLVTSAIVRFCYLAFTL
jgi:hypothetical protein